MSSAQGSGGGGVQPLASHDPVRIGPYTLLGRLGAGGMGRVYLARAEGGRTVAVKVVHEEHASTDEFRKRFRREIRAAKRVAGEYTADVLDADAEADPPWVATSYVPGPSLETVVRKYGTLPPGSVLALTEGLLKALRAIHGAGVVHRDLKPSNILLTVEGPRVIDFGIARAVQPSAESMVTRTGMVIGSPGFMAPEQVLGESVGPAADVFVLGCVLAYAASGALPFGRGATNQHAVMYRIVEGDPDLEGVPDEALRELVAACLTKDAALRPSVDALLARCAELDWDNEGEAWLPPTLVSQLARRSAELLAVDAPLRSPAGPGEAAEAEEEPGAASSDPVEPADRAAVGLVGEAEPEEDGPAKEDGPAGGGRPSRRRVTAVVAAAVALVLAVGGTALWVDRFGGDSGREDRAAPAASPSPASDGPGDGDAETDGKGKDGKDSDRRKDSDEEEGGKDAGKGEDGKKSGADKDGSGGEEGAGDGGSGSGGSSGGSGSGSGGGSGSGSGGGSSGGTSGGGSSAPVGSVPQSFLGTWEREGAFGPGPLTIRIQQGSKGERVVVTTQGEGNQLCVRAATLIGSTDGGTILKVNPGKVIERGPLGYCSDDRNGKSYVLRDGTMFVTAPNGTPSGSTYRRA